MAITAATLASDFSGFINPEQSEPIFEQAARMSVVQRLARQVPLGLNGKEIPVVTGRPVANWVAEAGKKPATKGTMSLETMTPKKLAAIAVDSMEVVRQNPGGYVNRLREELLPEAFAVAFDYATLHDLGGDGTGTGPFDNHIASTTKSVEFGSNSQANGGVYKDLVDGMAEIIGTVGPNGRKRRVTGFAFDDVAEIRFLGAVDSTGRPLWVDLPAGPDDVDRLRAGSLIGRRSFMGEGVADPSNDIEGFAGDWSQTAWGVVGGIEYSVSDQATVTINGELTSLWEHNLIAFKAEAFYGWVNADPAAFVQYRNDTGS